MNRTDNIKLIEALQDKGFVITDEIKSEDFGDYSITFTKDEVCIRKVSDRSLITIEICNNRDVFEWHGTMAHNWYEISKVASIFFGLALSSPEDMDDFTINNLRKILQLFDIRNYKDTKIRLS